MKTYTLNHHSISFAYLFRLFSSSNAIRFFAPFNTDFSIFCCSISSRLDNTLYREQLTNFSKRIYFLRIGRALYIEKKKCTAIVLDCVSTCKLFDYVHVQKEPDNKKHHEVNLSLYMTYTYMHLNIYISHTVELTSNRFFVVV